MGLLCLFRDIRRSVGWKIWALAILTFLSAVAEGMTIAILIPLFSLLGLGGEGGGGLIQKASMIILDAFGLPPTPASVGVLFGGLLTFSAGIMLAQARLGTTLQARYTARWQERLARAIMAARWTHLRDIASGSYTSAIVNDALRVGSAFYQSNLILTAFAFIAAQALIALMIAPGVTLSLIVLGVLLFAITRPLTRRASRDGQNVSDANADLISRVGEASRALKFVKATATEKTVMSTINPAIARIEQASAAAAFDVQLTRTIFEYGGGAAICGLLIAGPPLFGFDLASIIVVVAIFVRLFPKITAMRQCLQSIAMVLPSFNRVAAIEAAALTAREYETVSAADESDVLDARPARVELRDVTVTTPSGATIIDGITLEIGTGDFIALVGPSGAGKTTIVDLVLGLVEPTQGVIAIDNFPLTPAEIPRWRRQIGYLGQEPIVFSGTIADNLRWGRPNLSATMLQAALVSAAADQVRGGALEACSDIGEGGVRLSGGERQRIALARALAGTPRLLVLDEATSALDPAAEATLMRTLATLHGKVTIIAVAHRLWSVQDATRIIVLDHGRVLQSGTFEELLNRQGWFQDMARQQAGGAV